MAQNRQLVDRSTLVKLRPLNQLQSDDLNDLARNTYVETIHTGETLFSRGDQEPVTFFLLSGKVTLQSHNEASQSVQAESPQALIPLSNKKPRNETAVADGDITVIRLSDQLLGLMLNSAKLASESATPPPVDVDRVVDRLFVKLYQDYTEDKLVVPSMPDIAVRVRTAIQDPDKTADDIAKIVQADPALAARLVQVANSALYRGQSAVNSCRMAITRLGLNQTRNLVFSFALKQLFQTQTQILRQRMIALWKHTTLVASLSAVLARHTPGLDIDRALLAGLIHDIGLLPVFAYAERYPQLLVNVEAFDAIAQRLRGDIGAMVMKKWEFEPDLISVANEAENWQRDNGEDKADYCDIVIMAQLHGFVGTPTMAALPAIDQVPAYRKLVDGELTPRMSLNILEEAREDVREVQQLLTG